MITKQFKDIEVSMLGIGTMRLPVLEGDYGRIDEEQTAKMFAYALEHGVTYFDTAWGYHNGTPEEVTGRLLSKYPRESYYLATKFPGYDVSNMDKVEEIFEEQIRKCGVDYLDFYLLHNLCELNIEQYLDESFGIMDYVLKQKEQGRIKHLGFSAHASIGVLKRFLEAYGEHMEFGQLQVNWIDWEFQKAAESAQLLDEYSLPLWIMEPLRGGKLAKIAEEDEAKLKQVHPDWSIPEWAYRFLQTIPSATVVLTGASSLEQLKENVAAFETERPLNTEEMALLKEVAEGMIKVAGLPCTECRYCTSHCPQELDIPRLIELYNQRCFTGKGDFISSMATDSLPEDKRPSACTGCKSCEAVCPQQLEIADAMEDFAQKLAEK